MAHLKNEAESGSAGVQVSPALVPEAKGIAHELPAMELFPMKLENKMGAVVGAQVKNNSYAHYNMSGLENTPPPEASRARQRRAILKALQEGPLSSIVAREGLGIIHPAGRVMELRRQGYPIATHKAWTHDAEGRRHLAGFYTLEVSHAK
jgi:hypothetical protein